MHSLFPWKVAALALALTAPVWLPASAQSRKQAVQHLAPDSMTASDQSMLREHRQELAEAARIYGYNLAAGNWKYEQTLCSPMPDMVLLHYTQRFPDGTESLFTALVPRGPGRIRIVPVLYRSAAPFLPAPKNPHNYTLFNELVKTTPKDAGAGENWFGLGACYAEMTGGHIDLSSGGENIGIAGAPLPRVQIEPKDKTARVTVASREGVSAYKVWSISFNQNGRVTAASTEDQSVAVARVAQPAITGNPRSAQPQRLKEQTRPQPTAKAASAGGKTESAASTQTTTVVAGAASPVVERISPTAEHVSDAPGWKYVPPAADPPTKIQPSAPPPPEKVISEPPNPWEQSAQSPQ